VDLLLETLTTAEKSWTSSQGKERKRDDKEIQDREEGYEKKRALMTEQRTGRKKNKIDTSAVQRKKGKRTVL
jgi:hypothetical protein